MWGIYALRVIVAAMLVWLILYFVIQTCNALGC